jgi:16S rRNA (uracil1498-N3)-methyltransferase
VRRVVAHVFVDDLSARRPALSDNDLHHLSRVLRLRPGETVSASDGQGGVQVCTWAGGPVLEPAGPLVRHRRPAPLLTVGFALTKGDHPEWAVQKLTEAGADRILVIVSGRCVARWPASKRGHQLERLREVAHQAAMQSRRAWLPVVDGPVPFGELACPGGAAPAPAELGRPGGTAPGPAGAGAVAAGPGSAEVGGVAAGGAVAPVQAVAPGVAVALAVPGGAPLRLSTPTVLVGPEGGWTDEELAAVPHHVGLGPHILRAETAAVAAGVLLAALREGLVAEAV